MEDRLTQTFVRVCQEGSIRGAAIALGQEPSTISRRLTALENKLSITLLERRKKGVFPTEAGRLLLDFYRKSDAEFEVLLDEFNALNGMRRGKVELAVGDGFISDLLKNALPSFRSVYPGINYSLISGSTETVVRDVENDMAHIGFVYNSKPDRAIKIHASMQQPLEMLYGPDTEWASLQAPVSIEKLADLPLAMQMSGSGVGAMIQGVESIYGVRFNAVLESNALASTRNFVREGLGVTILPSFVVAREIADGTIASMPIDIPEFNRGQAALISRSGRRLPEAALKLIHHATRSMLAFRKSK